MTILIIDGHQIEAPEGLSILEAAYRSGIYIPALCAHPDLPPFSVSEPAKSVYRAGDVIEDDPEKDKISGCGLCLVEVEGRDEPVLACETPIVDGMKVITHSEPIERQRRENLSVILASHPRACLICPQSEGCDRLRCSLNIPPEERCCSNFSHCELRRVAQYVGIDRDIPEYIPTSIPPIKGGKLFEINFNLCIGCLRCVRACQDLEKIGALGFVRQGGKVIVGTSQPTLTKSGCKFCGACVAVCPTGAMVSKSEKCGIDLTTSDVMLPPKLYLEFKEELLAQIPEEGGAIQLLDSEEKIIYIAGTSDMRRELIDCLKATNGAKFFLYEKNAFFTQRQNELIQDFMEKNGQMPRINAELEDIF